MNIFRLIGDSLHVVAVIFLIVKTWKSRSCEGISGKSQVLFAFVFMSRYLDIFTNYVSPYNSFLKVFFIVSACTIAYFIFVKFRATYDSHNDTFRVELLVIFAVLLAVFLNHDFSVLEISWAFSIYLESVAILPQLYMISKSGELEKHVCIYLFIMAMYRALYIANWAYRYNMEYFYDWISIDAGCVQTALYCYFFFITRDKSGRIPLRLLIPDSWVNHILRLVKVTGSKVHSHMEEEIEKAEQENEVGCPTSSNSNENKEDGKDESDENAEEGSKDKIGGPSETIKDESEDAKGGIKNESEELTKAGIKNESGGQLQIHNTGIP